MDDFVEIFRDEQSWKVDMLEDVLKQKGIPCYRQSGAVTGLTVSPGLVSIYGPESIVYIPSERVQEVKDILSELPFDSNKTVIKERPPLTSKQLTLITIYLVILGLIAGLVIILTWK